MSGNRRSANIEPLDRAEDGNGPNVVNAPFFPLVLVSIIFFFACGLITITQRESAVSDMLTNFEIPIHHGAHSQDSRQQQSARILRLISESQEWKKAKAELNAGASEKTALSTLLKSRILAPLKDKLVQTSQIVQQLWGLKIHAPMEIDSVKPDTCSTRGRCRVQIYGNNLAAPGRFTNRIAKRAIKVHIGDTECTQVLWYSERKIKCLVGQGFGGNLNVTIQLHGQPYGETMTKENGFSYDPPDVTKLDPDSLTVGQAEWVNIKGFNFGHTDTSPVARIDGRPCNETKWKNDASILCLAPAFDSLGILPVVVDIQGQNQTLQVPVKKTAIPSNWPFDEVTHKTEPWKITTAVMIDRTGFSEKFFDNHFETILGDNGETWSYLKSHHYTDGEAIAVQMFRNYLNIHFNGNHSEKGLQNLDGVFVQGAGSKLDGNVQHDKEVITKQIQVAEAETGDTLSELAPVVGNIVKEVPTCAGYPDCENSDSAGHRGWTWHWHYSEKRGWKWAYRAVADGDQPPTSCPFCDPAKIHSNHSLEFTKERLEYCYFCSNNSFAHMMEENCKDFRDMCLYTENPDSNVPFAQSSSLVDPPAALLRKETVKAFPGSGDGGEVDGADNVRGRDNRAEGSTGNQTEGSGGNQTDGSSTGGQTAGSTGGQTAGSTGGQTAGSTGGQTAGSTGGQTAGSPSWMMGNDNLGGSGGSRAAHATAGSAGADGAAGGGDSNSTWRYSAEYQMTKWLHYWSNFLTNGRDRFVHEKHPSTVAEYSPEQFVNIKDYPDSRLPGAVGPAGDNIQDADGLIIWLVGFVFAIWIALLVFVYHRVMFISDEEYERINNGSDFSDDLDDLVFVYEPSEGSDGRASPVSQGSV